MSSNTVERDLFGNICEFPNTRKDWVGNSHGVFSTLGASNHAKTDRAYRDLYATPEIATKMLLEMETFSHKVWEPACGLGHISRVLESHGYEVRSTDIEHRDFGEGGIDLLKCEDKDVDVDVITNPPYKYAQEFVEKAMEVVADGHKVAMFLKLTFLEGKNRRQMYEKYPPKVVYVSSSRLGCGKNGIEWKPSSIAYGWFVWEKGFHGTPGIKWFN